MNKSINKAAIFKQITSLREVLVEQSKLINDKIVEKKNQLDSDQLICYLVSKCVNDKSSAATAANLNADKVISVSRQAIDKKRKKLDPNMLNVMLDKVYENISNAPIYKEERVNGVGRKLAVDGTKISINKKIPGYKLTKNKRYKKALISTLYSVDHKLPITFDLSEKLDERKSFQEYLMKYVKPGDEIAFDRGYYSKELIKKVDKNGSFFICRMKENSELVQQLNDRKLNDSYSWLEGYGIVRIVKYTINKEHYYLSTNMFNKTVKYLKDAYHERWFIEEFYKTLKCSIGSINRNYTSINKIKQEVNIQFMLVLVSRFLVKIVNKYINKNTNVDAHINFKTALEITGNHIMLSLLIKKSNRGVLDYLKIINRDKITVKPDRHFKRESIEPLSRWYFAGLTKDKNAREKSEVIIEFMKSIDDKQDNPDKCVKNAKKKTNKNEKRKKTKLR
jgi:hypothetical protein